MSAPPSRPTLSNPEAFASNLLLLTVGTGTAGRESNVADGLVATVRLLRPRKFWLMPSTSEKSVPVADLIREILGAEFAFEPWSSETDYRAIAHPDALEDCRQAVREVIAQMRTQLQDGERLLVNPTSGTKQMSAGAVLAALDESLGEVVFTVGERKDGVVRTGTERLEIFNATRFYAERDLLLARQLAVSGAPGAAALVLDRHDSLADAADEARCQQEWERANYEAARRIAARSSSPELVARRSHLTDLAAASKQRQPCALIVAELLKTADVLHERGDFESALFQTCRALEMGLRLRLFQTAKICDPYPLQEVCVLPIPDEFRSRLRKNSRNAQTCVLGLRQVVELLGHLGDPLAESYRKDRALQELVAVRNELVHAIRPVKATESREFLQRTHHLLQEMLEIPIR